MKPTLILTFSLTRSELKIYEDNLSDLHPDLWRELYEDNIPDPDPDPDPDTDL